MLHSSSDLYGASKIFLITALLLKDSGCYVRVILSEEGPLADQLRLQGVEVSIIRLGVLRRKYFNLPGLFNRLRVLKSAFKLILKLLKEEDINHIYSNTTAVLVGAWLAKRQRIYHTWHIHEIIVQPRWLAALIGKIIESSADQAIVVSEAVKNSWSKYVSSNKLMVVYNGIDYGPYFEPQKIIRNELAIGKDYLLIGMVGRVSHWKGQSYFLEVADQLCKSYSNLMFIIVGDAFPGGERQFEEMRQKIKSIGLENRVHTLGFRSDVPEILAELDIFVLPSILPDPFPTVILEAMAAGKPIVATAHGGACEMIENNKTGYLIPWKDASKAAETMSPILEDEILRQTMGGLGRERVLNKFSLEAFKRNILIRFPR